MGGLKVLNSFKQTLKLTFKKHKENYYKLVIRFPDRVQEMLMHVKKRFPPFKCRLQNELMPGAVFPHKIELTLAKEYICSSSFQHIEMQRDVI